jgi:hypothetical protein
MLNVTSNHAKDGPGESKYFGKMISKSIWDTAIVKGSDAMLCKTMVPRVPMLFCVGTDAADMAVGSIFNAKYTLGAHGRVPSFRPVSALLYMSW